MPVDLRAPQYLTESSACCSGGGCARQPQPCHTTPHGRLLGGLAEFERDLIRARTGEGRERAKARGVRMGCPPKLTSHQQREAIRRRDRDGETLADIARSYNVSAATISRLAAV
jgi:DNA invertase Pin-like site-specific DNA recombinase